MHIRIKFFIILSVSTLISACSEQQFAQPSCRVKTSDTDNHQGAGACIVRINGNLLVNQLDSGLYDLPNSNNISSTSEIQMSAQCAAHQSIWEQTGFNVEVQKVVGVQADGTWLFGCKLDAGFDGTEPPFDAPQSSNKQVTSVLFIKPFEIDLHNWARPDHFDIVKDAYVLQGNYQLMQD